MSESLNGMLLIASPSMPDYFNRTVILMVEHSDEGAFGLVLNRPSETTVGRAATPGSRQAGCWRRARRLELAALRLTLP